MFSMLRRTIFAMAACAAFPAAAGYIELAAGYIEIEHDPAMVAAIAKAQSTLPDFFARLAKPRRGYSLFTVKIRYATETPGGEEHIWAIDPVREGDHVTAIIDNEPRKIPNLKIGQRVTVPISQITDWSYVRWGLMHGAYTLRALLPHIPPEEAAELRRRLAPQ